MIRKSFSIVAALIFALILASGTPAQANGSPAKKQVPPLAPWEAEILMNNVDPDRAFFEQLAAEVKAAGLVLTQDIAVTDFGVGRIDLNGDGRYELIVQSQSEGLCGSDPNCQAFLYHHDGKRWRYIGGIYTVLIKWQGDIATFQEKRHHGWLTYRHPHWGKCWVTPEEIRAYYTAHNLDINTEGPIAEDDDGAGRRIDPDFGGYLLLPGNDSCWRH